MKKTFCVHCKRPTLSQKSPVSVKKASNGRYYLTSKCNVCKGKKTRFLSNAEAQKLKGKGLIGNLLKGVASIIPI